MSDNKINLGINRIYTSEKKVTGDFITRDGVEYYKIANYDHMDPFFISVVSDSDHWLYISTKGGLSAGRKNPENALFPYYTDDKIHDGNTLTGSKTILLVEKSGNTYLWEPFSERYTGIYKTDRNLYKSFCGNQLIFEEVNNDLGVTFSYSWNSSQRYGFVKKSNITNNGSSPVNIRILDGIQNLLPFGIDRRMQNEYSTLLDAYKKNELQTDSGLGLFLLSAIPVDKAEPSESLKAATVWSYGVAAETHLLSSDQLDQFRKGQPLNLEIDIRARRGAYFIESNQKLSSSESKTWYFIAEINQGPSDVVELNEWIKSDTDIVNALEKDIALGTKRLMQIVANADGLQKSEDKMLTTRHFANVLFNVMRGGIFDHNYEIQKADFISFIIAFNSRVTEEYSELLNSVPDTITYSELLKVIEGANDPQLKRLALEYLPLTFSRRHGDPSRPWNQFSIELQEENGDKKLYYAGNWRDIFQNWEALALSYPNFLEGIISKFVNASTADGYNPYRITRDGIDWEVIEEDDPWSYIGYWGDHQIIYLLKLLELSLAHHPASLKKMLTERNYSYANVPYRIKGYNDLLANPKDTVDFDHELENTIQSRVDLVGADGKLIWNANDEVYLVNLTEKLLVTLLSKLSNFIPEGGIWLNTQRPEWNDANNALVGNGVSMVTLYYIRRFITFSQSLFSNAETGDISISSEVAESLRSISEAFIQSEDKLSGSFSDKQRRELVDGLGTAGETYRNKVYKGFSGSQSSITLEELNKFFSVALSFTDHTIEANQRPDKLYHSYNLLNVEKDGGTSIRNLYEMLEGQVAVLSSGKLDSAETLEILKALRESDLYRADQHSYILYPDRQLPRFDVKNNIPDSEVAKSKLLQEMIASGDQRIVEKDMNGTVHFNGDFNNQQDVKLVLENLSTNEYGGLGKTESELILSIFEDVFDHQSFTGRSGTFFGYEGLGSIYWHMVSKLILAVEENCWQAIDGDASDEQIKQLIKHYYDVRDGLGTHKDPKTYGAFPSDPYSHTPGNAGAKQPGMTGQVKEDILARFGELGVFVKDGQICFRPELLETSEFLKNDAVFVYLNLNGEEHEIPLSKGSLAYTYCQVPFVYSLSNSNTLVVQFADGTSETYSELSLSGELSSEILNRTNNITKLEISFDLQQ